MINFLQKEIAFLNGATIEQINKGFSSANVFKVCKDKKEYILKIYKDSIGDKKSAVEKYICANQPIPKVIEYGRTTNFGFYIIMEYIKSGTLEELYDAISEDDIFNKAKILGEKQKILNEKYMRHEENFFEEFRRNELEACDRTINMINQYKNKLPPIDVLKIKEDMKRLINYFKYDKYFFIHEDLKAANIMVSDELLMIDYEETDLTYLPISLRYEMYHIMNNDNKKDKVRAFIRGIIIGLDEEQLNDNNLSKKLAYGYLKSAFVNITKYYIKNNKQEEAYKQIASINKVYEKCKNIEELIQI